MKRKLTFLLASLFLLTVIAGCGGGGASSAAPAESPSQTADTPASNGVPGASGDVNWPTRPVTLVVPANPGGDTDINARRFAQYLEQELGQPVIIVNTAGASGTIAAESVMEANDDHNLIFYHSGLLIAEIMGLIDYHATGYDLAAMPVMDESNCFAVPGDAPYDTVAELAEYARENPGVVSFGTETGSFTHLHVLAYEDAAGIELNVVDAGTAAEKTAAMLGGQLDIIGTQYGLIEDYITTGEMKVIGMLSEERLAGAPDVPTFKECGFDIVFNKFFYCGFAPGVDPAIIEIFNQASKAVAENPGYIADCETTVVTAWYMTPDEIVAYVNEEYPVYARYLADFAA